MLEIVALWQGIFIPNLNVLSWKMAEISEPITCLLILTDVNLQWCAVCGAYWNALDVNMGLIPLEWV